MKFIINKITKETYAIKVPGLKTKPTITAIYNIFIYIIVLTMVILVFSLSFSTLETKIEQVMDINYIKSNCDYKSAEPFTYTIKEPEKLLSNYSYMEDLSSLKMCSITKAIDVDYFIGDNIRSNISAVIKQVCTDFNGVRQILLNYLLQSDSSLCFGGYNELWFSTGEICVNKSTSLIFKGVLSVVEPKIDMSIWKDVSLRCYHNTEWTMIAKFSMVFGIFSIVKFMIQGLIKSLPVAYQEKTRYKKDYEISLMDSSDGDAGENIG
jgi:hypothetical protein